MTNWPNPFSSLEMPDDDGLAGEEKRESLTLDDVRKMTPAMLRMNDDARDIWHPDQHATYHTDSAFVVGGCNGWLTK